MANEPFKGSMLPPSLNVIEMRTGGSSPTCTYGSFQQRDTTNHGVKNAASATDCVGIWMSATSTTADATGLLATGGVWKTTGTAGKSLEPGDVFYIGSATTVTTGGTHATTKSQGLICESTTASGATALYILLIPSQVYTASTYSSS